MNSRFVATLLFIIIIGCILTGIIVYPQLPAVLVTHWNAVGHANGTSTKFLGVFIMPFIMLILVGILELLPRIDPIAPGFKEFRYAYDFFILLLISFLAYTYALILVVNLGVPFEILPMMLPVLALLIFSLGALLPYIKRNWFFGIRTPWTISNDLVWNKTHKLGSRLFETASIFILAATFFPKVIALFLVVVPILSAALIGIVYSYVVFQAQKKQRS